MKVSVIIPVYNKEHYVFETLQSLLEQTFSDWEAIVIDDGSKDNSADIVKSIKDPRIQFLQQSNHGVSYTRNKGIEMARGEFVAFLDADDTWFPDYLETVVRMSLQYPSYPVFCVAQKDRPIHTLPQGISIIKDFCSYPYIFWTGALLIKRNVFKEVGGFRVGVQLGEDTDMWLRISCKYHTVYLNEEHVYHPYITENNLAQIYDISKTFPFWEWYDYPYPDKKKLKEFTTYELTNFSNALVNKKQFKDALVYLLNVKGLTAIRKRMALLCRILLRY